jgi:hypothetical protein
MIDTVMIRVPLADGKQWRQKIPVDYRKDRNLFESHIKNMRISQTLDGVILWGSLAKYLNGENVTPLTRQGVREALDLLSTETGIDFSNGVLLRIDCGFSFITKAKPCEYLRTFDTMPIFKRTLTETTKGLETVLYKTKSGAYSFQGYDKGIETKGEVPPLYQGQNILRLEYGIVNRRGIKAKFGRDLKPYDLTDYDTYRKIQNLFLSFYESIPKTDRQVFVVGGKSLSPAKLVALQAEKYRQSCPAAYKAFLQTLKENGCLTEKSLERIKAKDRNRGKDYSMSDKGELITELDALVRMTPQTA